MAIDALAEPVDAGRHRRLGRGRDRRRTVGDRRRAHPRRLPARDARGAHRARPPARRRRAGARPSRPGRAARQRRRRSTAPSSRHITALKLNDEEAEQLCGGTDEASLRSLGIPEIVLTLGSEGAADHLGRDHDARRRGAGRRARSTRRAPATRSCSPMRRRASAGVEPHEAGRIASRFVSTIIAR